MPLRLVLKGWCLPRWTRLRRPALRRLQRSMGQGGRDVDFIPCGPWLEFSTLKRIRLTLGYWLPWVLAASWHTRSVFFRYWAWRIFKTRPALEVDFTNYLKGREKDFQY